MKGKFNCSENVKNIIAKIAIVVAILAIICGVFVNVNKNKKQTETQIAEPITDPEILRSLTYEQITEEEEKAQNEYVKLMAFFTRDLNGDGYAEKMKGTCREISATDELYIDLNVLTDGYLKDGVITLNAPNFTWKTSIISDNVVKGNYLGNTTSIKLQDNIPAGSQKLLWGTISSNVGNNINNYTNEATVTLTGTHVSDDGVTETPINKTVKVIVDWHGTVGAEIFETTINRNINDYKPTEDSLSFNVNFKTKEPIQKLLLKENVITVEIPQLNGIDPISVTTTGEYTYDAETRILTIKRNSVVNENGEITQTLARQNSYEVTIKYPKEAYIEEANSLRIEIPVTTYYSAYNNQNEQFKNPIISEVAEDVVVLSYAKPSGYIYDFDITVGEYSRNAYVVSKEKPLQIYNQIVEETKEDYYNVRWELYTGNQGEVTSVVMKETPEKYTDEFLNTSNEYTSMLEYVENVGIYFSGAQQALGKDGFIKLYNDETNELIHTFTQNDWRKYHVNNLYKYEQPIKHIRIETSAVAQNISFYVNHVKEINDELLVEKISREEFDELKYIYSYLQGSVQIAEQAEMSVEKEIGIAKYIERLSYDTLTVEPYQMETQKTTNNVKLKIKTEKTAPNDANWKNGQFIVKIPKEIVFAEINEITVDNSKVNILGYDLYEEGENFFIKIITENNEETTYNITIDCNITPDPSTKTSTKYFELYSYNEVSQNYYNPVKDVYDVNGNNNVEQNINYSSDYINFIAPSSIITSQYISNYDGTDKIKIAPNVVDIEKENGKANVNVVVLNNYTQTIDEVKILGVIPTEGNSYIVNGESLGSEFSVYMSENGIQVPEELKDVVTIYYSEKVNPSKELNDSNNGWVKNPTDWSKIKTYLIDFGDYIIQSGKAYTFTYEIEIPEKVNYNKNSYSEHAIYFALDTEGGKLLTQTEPTKLGVRVVRKYDLELVKHKKGFENLKVANATYSLECFDKDGKIVNKILITNLEGIYNLSNLYVGIEYTIKEIKSPENYILNNEEISFKIVEDEQGNLKVETKNEENVTFDNENNLVKITLENEPRYNLVLTKTDATTGEPLANIKFRINGKIYTTDSNGQLTVSKLVPNNEYNLVEEDVDGYYALKEIIKFKLIKNENGQLIFESNNDIFKNAIIENTSEEDLIKVTNVIIKNEKIPTYSLQVIKVAKSQKQLLGNLTVLKDAKFKLESEDLNTVKQYTTDSNGQINISNLYQYIEGQDITGNYILQEIEAPKGYSNDLEAIKFKVKNSKENGMELEIENIEDLKTLKDAYIDGNTVKIIVEDTPLFSLVKTDAETGKPLANVQFAIYEIDTNGDEIGFAKDVNGNYIGELNEENLYVVTTDENGNITLPLKDGKYKAVEITYLEGYAKNEDEYFEILDGGAGLIDDNENIIEINSIEDLVSLSNSSYSGNIFNGKTVKLMRNLDFEDDASYNNPNDTRFGDWNLDGIVEGIKLELTDKVDGIGFRPIKKFSGIFDGQKYEIRNIYINNYKEVYSNVGLFSEITDAYIKNLGITGIILGCRADAGGITGISGGYSKIENCYNLADISSKFFAGGIVAEIEETKIENCYNKGEIFARSVGGIVGYGSRGFSNITNCYNTGNIICDNYVDNVAVTHAAGGISGEQYNISIKNCYNTGDIKYVYINNRCYFGGISGLVEGYLYNCYNIGNVLGTNNAYSYTGGIIGKKANNGNFQYINCYYSREIRVQGSNNSYIGGTYDSAYMQSESFINNLGEEFKIDAEHQNNGYPILKNKNIEYIDKINYIEDLVKLSIDVSKGKEYIGRTIRLQRTLDFNDANSYKNAEDTSYGDLNKDGVIQSIKLELTNRESGCGFTPIGINSDNYFSGIFNGQGYEIRNIYISDNDNSYLGLFGYVNYGTIKNLGITGELLSNVGGKTIGGIVGYSYYCDIYNCYNGVKINSINSAYIGGVVGRSEYSNIELCYNLGEININSSEDEYCYYGGIVGSNNYGLIRNCYNISEIKSTRTIESSRRIYLGGIAGANYNSNIMYCYNIGDLINKGMGDTKSSEVGTIYCGYNNSSVCTKCYWLDTINIEGTNIVLNGQSVSEEYMLTKEFYEELNTDGVWTYKKNSYPKLNTKVLINIGKIKKTTNINIKNSLKEFKITTEVGENSENKREGGTITGTSIKDNPNILFVENVKYNSNNKNTIKIIPDSGYEISEMFINNESVDFVTNENGEVIISSGYFNEVKEDKHIIVVFEKQHNLIITKVDEQNNEIKLQGAKFSVEIPIDKDSFIGELQDATGQGTTHHFRKDGNIYISTNKGVGNSVSNSCIPIDLRDFPGYTFGLLVWASVSSESNYDYGYANVTKSTVAPQYTDTTGQILKISGSVSSSSPYSIALQGGDVYYLHIGYRKDGSINSGNDEFKVNEITLAGGPSNEQVELQTNKEGKASLVVPNDTTITIKETKAPDGYILNSTSKTVTVANGEIKEFVISNKLQQGNEKFELKVIKQDSLTNQLLSGAEFLIQKQSSSYQTTITTNENGEAEVNLENGTYTIKETKAPEGYSLNEEIQTVEIQGENKEVIIKNTPKKVNITTKVEKTPAQKVDGGTITGKDEQPYEEVSYSQTSTKDILINPDDGYQIKSIKINGKEIEFTPDANGNVLLDKFVNMQEDKEVIVRFEPVYEPNFTLTKKDEYTNEPLEGIQFAVYYLSIGNDFAKDKNGYYIGRQDANGMYIVTTDSNGEVKLSLPTGLYKAVEVKGANGYVLPEKEEDRTTYFRVVAKADIEINYIEDLIELSSNVTNGNTYEGKVISLARDLDFNDVNSYRNANDMTTYGDYNGNEVVETLIEELTNSEGCGFNPIGGNPDNAFKGIFDGNCFELKNMYINTKYGTLFTNILDAELLNLKLTNANIINSSCGAGFAYYATNSRVYNCEIEGVLNTTNNAPTAGIIYTANNCEIINCYNNAAVTGVCTGGISSYINNSLVENCYNAGDLTSTGPAGGIGYSISESTIENCYNTGNVNGKGTCGGIASGINNSLIENCYNTGKIKDTSAPAGGLSQSISNSTLKNCYNIGDVFGASGAGGIAQSISSSNLENCYNEGNVSSINSGASGIGLYISNSSFKECYNIGNVSSVNNVAGGFSSSISGSSFEECYNTGNVSSEYTTSGDTNGAAGFAITFTGSNAVKCFNEGNISSKYCAAGFSLKAGGSNFEKCYNKGEITATQQASGIINIGDGCNIINVYNKGNVVSNGGNVGGIAGSINYTYLEKCANMGNLSTGPSTGGLVYSCSNSKIIKSYNTGICKSSGTSGGLCNYITNSLIQDCYNVGEVVSNAPSGGLSYGMTGTTINNCYNLGKVTGYYGIAGIVEYNNSNSKINNCYNAGELALSSSGSGTICGIIYVTNSQSDLLKNTYYLNTTAQYGANISADISGITESKSIIQMISRTFVNTLNANKELIETSIPLSNWEYNLGGYPVLDFEIDMYEYNKSSEQQPENVGGNISTEDNINEPVFIPNYEKIESQLIITNSKSAKIIVHHYLEGTGPEFENEPTVLASDEIIMGKENYEYVTAPNLNIEGYNLIQDKNGEYIIPENAIGRFMEEEQHIYYYYNVRPLELVVHHYLEGTEDKLADDEQYFYNENEHYKTTPSEKLLNVYEIVRVEGDEEKDITQNEVVTYYYEKKEYKVTTKVVIPETEIDAGRTENGGTILGENETPYEVVKHGENSTKDIIATPDSGYKVSSITVNGKVVPFTIEDGVVTIDKFENMTEDKEVIVEFMPIAGKVITHHYLQGTTEKLHEDVINVDKVGAVVITGPIDIENYKLIDSAGNKDENGNVVIVKEIHEGVEEIIYYYQKAHIITTDVIEHEEKYKDGTVKQGIKGGSITNEDVVIHEQIIRYEDSVKVIEMKPADEYEVVEVRINGQVEDLTKLELDENGDLVIPEGFFTNVQKDIHVEVQYRRNSKVIVKYLEDGTEKELAEEDRILGYEGKEFQTAGKIIPGYTLVMEVVSNGNESGSQDGNQDQNQGEKTIKITDENFNPTQPNGTMFSDDITVIYWYEKIDANVIERHIETNAKGEEKEIEFIVHNDDTAATVETLRKEYEKYISTNAPEETKEKVEKEFGNVTFAPKEENKVTVKVDTSNVKEVWYYYIKQYNITTEVKLYKQSINGVEIEVEGGTISKKFKIDENGKEVEDIYEVVDNRADSKKEIKMVPEDGYRIKSVTINDEEIYIDNMVAEDGSLLLPVAYFKDIQKDYHVVVEYERIPAKVIVQYIDEFTKESILPDKVIDGFVNDEYNESRVEIDSYIAAEPEPENSQGKMIDGVITIVYYYGKQYKITTDVIEHLEDEEKSIVDVIIDKIGGSITVIPEGKKLVKGGSIQGEDEQPYEAVLRGKNNIKEILIKPDAGYRIKSLKIKDGETEYIVSVPDLLTKENTIILPKEYFKNIQSDKHIMVEFEPIPAKVMVNYLDIDTKDTENPEKVSTSEEGKGFVNYDYKTYAKDIPYYELVKEEMPSNAQGKLTEKDTIVNYWYRKLLFNMKLTKEFSSIQVNGEERLQEDKKFAKIDIANTEVGNTNILVKYKITVTNTEKVEGVAKIVENIPVGFKYVANQEVVENVEKVSTTTETAQTPQWTEVDGKLELTTKTLKPGETVEYEITLEWDKNQNCIGNLINTATITETQNIPQYEETTKEDNKDSCTLILAIRTREDRDIKTIVSISCFVLAGICTAVYVGMEVYARRKEDN